MTTSYETIHDTVRRDGETFSHTMQRWVDNYFYALGQILIIQRDFVRSCLTATSSAAKTATSGKD